MILITFEGCDGVGKSSQSFMLAEALKQKYRVYYSREPLGAPVFDNCRFGIKQLLSSASNLALSSEVMLYLMSRLEHLRYLHSISAEYDFAILDRFADSTEAYQCYGLGFELTTLRLLSKVVLSDSMVPDITFLLDADYQSVLNRQSVGPYYYESLGEVFYNKVRNGFLDISKEPRHIIIDAAKPAEEITRIVLAEVINRVPAMQE